MDGGPLDNSRLALGLQLLCPSYPTTDLQPPRNPLLRRPDDLAFRYSIGQQCLFSTVILVVVTRHYYYERKFHQLPLKPLQV